MQTVRIAPEFWRGRRVFVTGHTGFIGGWLTLWLGSLGARVTGFSLEPPTEPNFFEAVGLDDGIDSLIDDIRDLRAISQAVTEADPEIVFHLAAQPLVRTAFHEPVHTFSTNVMGTVNLLEAVRRPAGIRAVVVFTTDKVYDNQEWVWGYRETDRLGGREAYGASKAASELVVDAYRESYLAGPDKAMGIATVRAGNVIGGGDWADERLIPDAIRAFTARQPLWVRNPDAVRPWQHVLDPVRGILLLAERLAAAPHDYTCPWNLGPAEDHAQPVAAIVDAMTRLWGDGARWATDQRRKPYEARMLALNSARAAAALGWRTRWDVETALGRTVEWYRAYFAGADMRAFSLTQIEAHDGGVAPAHTPRRTKTARKA